MILTINNRVPSIGNMLLIKENNADIILDFKVKGTYFPARYSTDSATLEFVGLNSVNNIMYVDFHDGTGEHEYPFKANGVNRRLRFDINATTTNPATLSVAGTYNYPAYFYQDLPAGIINTVDDDYGDLRTVTIRFEKPQSVGQLTSNRVAMYEQLPGAISKLGNLTTLYINASFYITSFPQDFLQSNISVLTLNFIGNILNNGIPLWVLNSPLTYLSLSNSVNLSGTAVEKRLDKINMLKHTLVTLWLNGSQINYPLPEQFGELYKLEVAEFDNIPSPLFRFPDDLSNLIALRSIAVSRTVMPLSEYERLMQNIPSLRTLNLRNLNISTDFDISENNNYITSMLIGGSPWNAGAIPSFVNKLIALLTLDLRVISASLQTGSNLTTSWGNFQNCINLVNIDYSRIATMPVTVPAWFVNLTKLKNITAPAAYTTLTRVNDFVNNWYAFVTANAPITGTSLSPFRNMVFNLYGTSSVDTVNSVRPSGLYQQPAGFVPGNNNGSPASQMEKIWVLVNQYSHTWIVKPA